jgi:hypothetical protein
MFWALASTCIDSAHHSLGGITNINAPHLTPARRIHFTASLTLASCARKYRVLAVRARQRDTAQSCAGSWCFSLRSGTRPRRPASPIGREPSPLFRFAPADAPGAWPLAARVDAPWARLQHHLECRCRKSALQNTPAAPDSIPRFIPVILSSRMSKNFSAVITLPLPFRVSAS